MKRSKFSLSHYRLFSGNMGDLIPIGLYDVLPGDTVQQATSALIRLAPLNAPVMHPVNVKIHHWFVPYRLLWEDWENFITGGPDGDDASVYPTITLAGGSGAAVGSLADYLGCVPGVNNLVVDALPFRAYAMIYNEWYRDQDLQNELAISLASGADSTTNTTLQKSNWEKDYFTSSRPWAQKGPDVTLQLGNVTLNTTTTDPMLVRAANGGALASNQDLYADDSPAGALTNSAGAASYVLDPNGRLDAGSITVNDLRLSLGIQRYQEARARYGSRYTEYLRYLGVRSSDARLQRPEYLGGGKQTIQFSEVLQTAEGTDPVGELRGHGISALRSNRFRRFFEEHGVVMSFMTVRPKTIYASGLPRRWNKRTKEDFWQRELQHIGQQEVLNKEVYAAHATPDGTFGYQDRYDEYRRLESGIAGEFRTTLDYWHLARIFGSTPALNSDFVTCNPTTDIFASTATDGLYVMANHSIQARRLVSQTGSSFTY